MNFNIEDFVPGTVENQWVYTPTGAIFVGRPGMTIADVIAEVTAAENAPAPAPASVTPRQARLALNQFGLRSSVETWVSSQSQDVQDTWQYATQIQRTDALVTNAATALGLTDAQLDALFVTGAAL